MLYTTIRDGSDAQTTVTLGATSGTSTLASNLGRLRSLSNACTTEMRFHNGPSYNRPLSDQVGVTWCPSKGFRPPLTINGSLLESLALDAWHVAFSSDIILSILRERTAKFKHDKTKFESRRMHVYVPWPVQLPWLDQITCEYMLSHFVSPCISFRV